MKYFFKTLTLAVLVSLVASLFLLSFKAEEPQDSAPVLVETQQITDNLSNPEEIKQYPVTVAEKGDLMITLAGLQERWDGYTYHWHATLFAEDKTTVITKESVRGYCGIEGYATTLSLPDMEAGTYYLQMTSVAYQNPLMATFTDASYQISITPFYHSVPESPASDKLKTVSKAGEVICKIEDTVYVKLNDGEALAAVCYTSSGKIVPVLVSENREAVAYYCSKDGKTYQSNGSTTYVEDADYYATYVGQTSSRYSGDETPLYYAAHGDVEDILMQRDWEILGWWEYFWKYYDVWVYIGGAVLVILVFCFICRGGSGGGGGLNDMTGDEPWTVITDALIDGM